MLKIERSGDIAGELVDVGDSGQGKTLREKMEINKTID